MMEGLVLDIAHYPGQLTFTEGNHAILVLPEELIIGSDDVIDEMGTVALDFTDKPSWGQAGRDRDSQMDVVGCSTDRVDDSAQLYRFGGNGFVQSFLKKR